MSSSIPSWQILTAHAQPFRGARDLAFCLKVPLDSLLVWASSEGSGETARMRRLAWTFAARIGDKYQIRLTRSKSNQIKSNIFIVSPHSCGIHNYYSACMIHLYVQQFNNMVHELYTLMLLLLQNHTFTHTNQGIEVKKRKRWVCYLWILNQMIKPSNRSDNRAIGI